MNLRMATEDQKRWAEFDQRLKQAEKRILATGNLVRAGIPMLVDTQARLDALIDSDARLYGRLEQLAGQIAELVEAQKRTERSLKAFIDSTRKGGNGNRR